MKKILWQRIFTLLMVFFILIVGDGYATDTSTFQVSCSIPSVPGINAPLITQEETRIAPEEETRTTPNTEEDDAAYAIKETARSEEMLLATGQNSSILVQTFYVR